MYVIHVASSKRNASVSIPSCNPKPNACVVHVIYNAIIYVNKYKLKEGFPSDHAILPSIVADTVAGNDSEMAAYLERKANYHYANNPVFRTQMNGRGNKGRDSLYAFMNHWKEAGKNDWKY